MEFVLVEHMDEVLEQALLKSGENNENQKFRDNYECCE